MDHLNVIALVKDGPPRQTFIFLYDEESVTQLYDQLEVLAADEELSFTLMDVLVVCRKIKALETINVLDLE